MPSPADVPQPPTPARPFAYGPGAMDDSQPAGSQTLAIDGLPLPLLASAHGTPLYLYSAAAIRHRFGLFEHAFASIPHTVCYAVKANSSLALLQLLGRLGAGFDIVSGGELERVRRAHPDALDRVVFSGVGKQAWEIDAALDSNILLFNVESADELDLLAARAHALRKPARFALRVNPDVFAQTHPYISTGLSEHKFGIDIELARDLYRHAATLPSLRATGVSVHIGSQIEDVHPFAEALRRVVTLVQQLRADGHPITHIDAGGGLGIDYQAPLDVTTFESPESQVAAYGAALLPALEDLRRTLPELHLLLEPGRFLVAQAGGLLTRVLRTKQNGSKHFVITDAAMNDLIRPALYQAHHEIVPVTLPQAATPGLAPHGVILAGGAAAVERPASPTPVPVDVVGPVCESGDFFAHDRPLAPIAAGDLLLLLDAGAYGMSQASNYNTRPRPAELLIEDGRAHLVRRRETIDDLLASEHLL